jgi:hypothetical protein
VIFSVGQRGHIPILELDDPQLGKDRHLLERKEFWRLLKIKSKNSHFLSYLCSKMYA